MSRVVVAYSGGVDSSLLAKVAHDVLGDQAVAVTALSASLAESERAAAAQVAAQICIRHELIVTHELDNAAYRRNDRMRCFHCKAELFDCLQSYAAAHGIPYMVYGPVVDDLGDFRPGMAASRQRGARAPMVEAGLRKADVRELARRFDLPTWNKPAQACLASRVAYGTEVTVERLSQVERAEALLRAEGLHELRVRHHDSIARIEVPAEALPRLVADHGAPPPHRGRHQGARIRLRHARPGRLPVGIDERGAAHRRQGRRRLRSRGALRRTGQPSWLPAAATEGTHMGRPYPSPSA